MLCGVGSNSGRDVNADWVSNVRANPDVTIEIQSLQNEELDGKLQSIDVKVDDNASVDQVQASIQGDQVRVTSASKDDLQDAMRALRDHDFGVALQLWAYVQMPAMAVEP